MNQQEYSHFGRAISEVGAVMIVGGNINHFTRVMTTAISLETRMGNLEYAMALGIVLILLTIIIYSLVYIFNKRKIISYNNRHAIKMYKNIRIWIGNRAIG